ncbi:hypothetical protein DMN91_003309 [Ooceraea biroi]|uniref:Double jelly roll-like domain-containing protein n=1 Tax=Ooceraea biroi TaxID=2015173 RepID=A0A3L8DXX2_OOCBI|nr:hypothetical protein DMN91_003309 [Ooceraea biroi]
MLSHHFIHHERVASVSILSKRARERVFARDSTLGERAASTAVWAAMKAKTKLGMGLRTTKKKTTKKRMTKQRILPIAKRGGVLPILPMLGALGSLAAGAAGITKAVNDSKAYSLDGFFFIMSLTLTLTGRSSILAANYFPAIDLSDGDYELGLVVFETYHTIPNEIAPLETVPLLLVDNASAIKLAKNPSFHKRSKHIDYEISKMTEILNIGDKPIFDHIVKIETHTYNPYANATFGYSDEIRIPIQHQDLYTLPCESFLYVEAFMFDEIRYELNGVDIDRSRNAGITSTLKNYVSLTASRNGMLKNAGWDIVNFSNGEEGHFNFCVPLSMLLGCCEDYRRVVINARHELILIRSRNDNNCLRGDAEIQPEIELLRVQWRMPHVALNEINKLAMLRTLESGRFLSMSFRSRLITKAVMDDDDNNDDDEAPPIVYVKGLEKREWLRNLLLNDDIYIETIDAHYEDIPSLNKLDVTHTLRCNIHVSHCALQNYHLYNDVRGRSISVGPLTVRFSESPVCDNKLIYLESSNIHLAMTDSTFFSMLNLDRCIDLMFDRLNRMVDKVDTKFAQYSNMASINPKNVSNAIRASNCFDENHLIDCELLALVFSKLHI